jgi:hypothetical protein
MRLQVTQDGEYIVIDGNGNDALKISENRNGTLELTFLSTGAWSAGTGRLYGDKKTTVGMADTHKFGLALGLGHNSGSSTMKAKDVPSHIHPAKDFNNDHMWHYQDDPYDYITGVRGLSIASSADRAVVKIQEDIWTTYGPHSIGDENELFDVCGKLLEQGVGRNYLYRLAGRAKNIRKPFSPTSLTTIFKHLAAIDGNATS